MKTYTSVRGLLPMLREARDLYRIHKNDIPGKVRGFVTYMGQCEEKIARHTDLKLEGKDVLIIGPGQRFGETTYFGMKNRATAIDLDVIIRGFDLRGYLAMLRRNGSARTLKTLGRKCLGLDRQSEQALCCQFGVTRLPKVTSLQMDAAEMTFPDNSFDFVYSFSVFEHLPNPHTVLAEISRVLRPGGVCYTSLHSFTSDSGCHDIRIWSNNDRPPYWSHLRPQHKDKVQPNAYLNGMRLAEWEETFRRVAPEVHFYYEGHHAEYEAHLLNELKALRKAGELAEYSDKELMTLNLVSIWQKPREAHTQAVVQERALIAT